MGFRQAGKEQDVQRVSGCSRIEEGVLADHVMDLRGRPQQYRHLVAKTLRDCRGDSNSNLVNEPRIRAEHDVAALDVALHIAASCLDEKLHQVFHRKLILATDVYSSK